VSDIPRDFKGIWIPKEIWLDNTLTYFEKCLLAEIHSLDGKDGCFASNEYLCKFFNEKERKIQDALSKLKAKGYIKQVSFDGRTRVLKTDLHPKNDKSFFSTSEVSNSAPLGCRISHPSLYIENKDLEKTTTDSPKNLQHNIHYRTFAAVSSEKKSIKHKCLESVEIPESEKDWISQHYPEDVVAKAISWAKHPETKIKTTLTQAIKWACQNKPETPKKTEDLINENKNLTIKIMKSATVPKSLEGLIKLEVLHSKAEIVYMGSQKQPIIIEYEKKGFKEVLVNSLQKAGFILPQFACA